MPINRKVGLPVDGSLEVLLFSLATITAGTGTFQVPIHGGTFQIVSVGMRVQTAPSGGSEIVDVNKNGTTIYSTQGNRPTVTTGNNNATVGAHTATTVTTGDYISVDVDTHTAPAANMVVSVRLQRIS